MKLLFVTDLHGCKWKYERLFEIAKKLSVAIVINGGDLLPKNSNLHTQEEFTTNYLDPYQAQYNATGIYYLCCLGNDDLKTFDELFFDICSKYKFVTSIAQRKVEILGFEFIGMNWVADYPFRLKDRCRIDTSDYVFQAQFGTGLLSTPNGYKEIDNWQAYAQKLPTIEDELNRLPCPKDMKRSIYVIHMPPSDVGLDKCGHGAEVGSKAVYNFLKKHQPKLSLHGHIHESPEVSGVWNTKIGDTVCIQPGQLEDSLTYVVIDLSTMKADRVVERK